MTLPSTKKIQDLEFELIALGIVKDDLDIRYITGNSKGGQKQNRTKNCVFIKHIPTELSVKCHKSRSKETNLFFAKRLLSEKIQEYFGVKTKSSEKYDRIKKQKKRRKRRQENEE